MANAQDKSKVFRDPIYGYISIPNDYCRKFIDTPIFQRLRRIEQTSMRILYPSAHHDRFAHSLGVFHLGSISFQYMRNNSEIFYDKNEISEEKWDSFRKTFEIACLLHDCGHSPFSHTFEHFYVYQKEEQINEELDGFFPKTEDFLNDLKIASPSPHEKISALLVLKQYKKSIEEMDASALLAARMILGCKYSNPNTQLKKIENKLISLLNGNGIDVDALDYIQRDSWSSGVSNVRIDFNRLLSSIMVRPTNDGTTTQIVFKKSALSVLDNISIGRNFLYKWIYSHHIVNYEQFLLSTIIEKIDKESNNEFCNKIFSLDSFFEPINYKETNFYLPTDDDLMHVIKQYNKIAEVEEFLSRNYQYKALWKTYFEFHSAIFRNTSATNRLHIGTQIKDGNFSEKYKGQYRYIKVAPKLKSINKGDFFIDIDGRTPIDAAEATSLHNENLDYFILYVSPELIDKKDEIIKTMQNYQI